MTGIHFVLLGALLHVGVHARSPYELDTLPETLATESTQLRDDLAPLTELEAEIPADVRGSALEPLVRAITNGALSRDASNTRSAGFRHDKQLMQFAGLPDLPSLKNLIPDLPLQRPLTPARRKLPLLAQAMLGRLSRPSYHIFPELYLGHSSFGLRPDIQFHPEVDIEIHTGSNTPVNP